MASSTEFQSPSGSQWATDPHMVPRLRTSGSAIHGAADATAPETAPEAAMSAWRTSAPTCRWPLWLLMASRPSIRLMSTSFDGVANRSFIIGRRLCPPARIRVSSPPSALASMASSTEEAAT